MVRINKRYHITECTLRYSTTESQDELITASCLLLRHTDSAAVAQRCNGSARRCWIPAVRCLCVCAYYAQKTAPSPTGRRGRGLSQSSSCPRVQKGARLPWSVGIGDRAACRNPRLSPSLAATGGRSSQASPAAGRLAAGGGRPSRRCPVFVPVAV